MGRCGCRPLHSDLAALRIILPHIINVKGADSMTVNIPEADSTQELLEEYETKIWSRSDDAPAMQAAVCAVLAAVVFLLDTALSGTAEGIFNMIKEFSVNTTELFPNPAELLCSLF